MAVLPKKLTKTKLSDDDLMRIALTKYCTPHGHPNPETYAYIEGMKNSPLSPDERTIKMLKDMIEKIKQVSGWASHYMIPISIINSQITELEAK